MKQQKVDRYDVRVPFDDRWIDLNRDGNPTVEEHRCTHLGISVSYDKGGTNMFSGNAEQRGYRVSLTPLRIADGSMIMMVGDNRGYRILIEVAKMLNRKRLEFLGNAVIQRKDAIYNAYIIGDRQGVAALVRGIAADGFTTVLTNSFSETK